MSTTPLISKGMNRKLSPGGIAVFNLPAGVTCSGGRTCAGCYAMKSQRMYKSCREKRASNLVASQAPDFVEKMKAELETGHCKKTNILRFHESGDFYAQEYINRVVEIAKAFPNKYFYAYTKRLAEFNFAEMVALPNVTLINSHNAELPGGFNFGEKFDVLKAAQKTGAFICPAKDGVTCNVGCDYCCSPTHKAQAESVGVVFVKH